MGNNDSFTEVTSQSWLSRLGGAFKGILFGIVCVVGSVYLLWWNEGRAVKTAKTLEEGAGAVVSIDNDNVNPDHEGALVHLTGKANTEEILEDNLFDVSVNGIKLRRNVEMYQWVEKRDSKSEKKLGGSEETTTTYSYEKSWASSPVNSNNFKKTEGHENPSEFKYKATSRTASNVELGAFKLSSGLVDQINAFKTLELESVDTTKVPNAKLSENVIFIGDDISNPQVGDMKVSFQVVSPSDVSLIARQVSNSFEPYKAKAGGNVFMLSMGNVSAESMFDSAKSTNTTTTWLLRFVGLFIMYAGFGMVLKPISVIGDVVPFIGNILAVGIGIISGLASFSISFVTISLAWIYYRPVLGITLLVVGGAAAFFAIQKINEKKKLKEAQKASESAPAV
ncbi:TMEM43 family protein [Cytophagaceae bacterium ABcell3]|nr:TMEM43 family protein [Cytophagaceae bacterium ABcell3]